MSPFESMVASLQPKAESEVLKVAKTVPIPGQRPRRTQSNIERLRLLDPFCAKRRMIEQARTLSRQRAEPEVWAERARRWRSLNPSYGRVYERLRHKNPEYLEAKRQRTRASYERNRESVLARQAERQRELSTPGAIRSRVLLAERQLRAADIPDETLGFFKAAILVSRELKKASKK